MERHPHPDARRTRIVRVVLALLVAALFAAGCAGLDPIPQPAASTGSADFSSYVALGTSVSMGIESGGLVDEFQINSVPALIARQTGANGGTFIQPLCAEPGLPNLITVESLAPLQLGLRPGSPPATPYIPRPADGYDNLAISGAVLANVLARESGFPYFDIVLQGQGTMIRQCLAQRPTFVTVELGVNDAVRAVFAGGDPAQLISVGQFQALYTQIMDSLAIGVPNAKFALANIPQVTEIPYATTVPLVVTAPLGPNGAPVTVRLRDGAGPLPDGSLILLPASPLIQTVPFYGFPPPAPPLPDSLVITVAERAAIESAVSGYNTVIAQQSQARGAALVDEFGLFDRLNRDGFVLGGTTYRTDYISGGLFSFDGVHPSALGSGILANAFITAINSRFGARIPVVDLSPLTNSQMALAAGR